MSVLSYWENSNQSEHRVISIKDKNIEWRIYEYELGKDYGLLEFDRWVIAFEKDVVVICKWYSWSTKPRKQEEVNTFEVKRQ